MFNAASASSMTLYPQNRLEKCNNGGKVFFRAKISAVEVVEVVAVLNEHLFPVFACVDR
jgi:hypothetical protein